VVWAVYHLLCRRLCPDASRVVIGQMRPATGMHVGVEPAEDQINRSKAQIKAMAIAIGTDWYWASNHWLAHLYDLLVVRDLGGTRSSKLHTCTLIGMEDELALGVLQFREIRDYGFAHQLRNALSFPFAPCNK
jgi:hypothetical protein